MCRLQWRKVGSVCGYDHVCFHHHHHTSIHHVIRLSMNFTPHLIILRSSQLYLICVFIFCSRRLALEEESRWRSDLIARLSLIKTGSDWSAVFAPSFAEYEPSQGPDKKRTVYQMALSKSGSFWAGGSRVSSTFIIFIIFILSVLLQISWMKSWLLLSTPSHPTAKVREVTEARGTGARASFPTFPLFPTRYRQGIIPDAAVPLTTRLDLLK